MSCSFEITRTTITSKRIPYSVRIVHISDLHDCKYGQNQAELIDAVTALQPDIVVCTGDLFNRRKSFRKDNAFDLVSGLSNLHPVFIVEGNHEARLGTIGSDYLSRLSLLGARILRNESFSFQFINLIGLQQRPSKEDLERLIMPDQFNLVLSHRPELFSMYSSCRSDLILSGHAHGGQIRIGNIALVAPQQGLFPKFTSGLYRKDESMMYVSRGLGDTVLIPRINNPHEVALICLEPE